VELVQNPRVLRVARVASALVSGRCLQIAYFLPADFVRRRAALVMQRRYDLVYSHYIRSHGHNPLKGMVPAR